MSSPPQYSHTTSSNLKLSPLAESFESCPEVFTAQAGPGEARGAAGVPAVLPQSTELQHWVLPGAAVPAPHPPLPPHRQAFRVDWDKARGGARTGAAMLQREQATHTRRMHGRDCGETPREHAARSGSSHHGNPGFQRQTKPFPAIQQRVTVIWGRCLQQMSVPTDLRRI